MDRKGGIGRKEWEGGGWKRRDGKGRMRREGGMEWIHDSKGRMESSNSSWNTNISPTGKLFKDLKSAKESIDQISKNHDAAPAE